MTLYEEEKELEIRFIMVIKIGFPHQPNDKYGKYLHEAANLHQGLGKKITGNGTCVCF